MKSETEPILSIIIVSWNTKEVTSNCLNSLFSQPTSTPFEVYVVDNASCDGSSDMVERDYPKAVLIRNAENVGFARANNQILRMVETPYVLLLNSDTVIPDRDIFTPWISFMDRHRDVGMSGCRLVFPDLSHQVGDAGYRPSVRALVNHCFLLSRFFPRRARGLFITHRPENTIDVDWISGAAMMVRVQAVREAGLMDESIFMFAEDIEWGCRFREKGWRVVYIPSLEIIHLQGASSKKQIKPSEFSLLWLKNIKKLYLHLNPLTPPWSFELLMGLGFFIRAQIYGWKGTFLQSRDFILKAKRMMHYIEGILSK